jgi:carbamoyltransferase
VRILGLLGDGKNPGACLVSDGALVAFVEEERVTRFKSSHGFFPARAAKACLEIAGLGSLDDIDAVAWAWDAHKYPTRMARFFARAWLRNRGRARHPLRAGPARGAGPIATVLRELDHERPATREERLRRELRAVGLAGRIPPLHFLPHHLCHAASAYHLSGFQDAAILVMDGSGEDTCTILAHGSDDRIRQLESVPIPDSLGWYYAAFTEVLGFTPYRDEGKLMGLAAYGEMTDRWEELVSRVLQVEADGSYQVNPRFTLLGHHHLANHASDELVSLCGGIRARDRALEDDHRNLAHAVQKGLERAALGLARRALQRTGSPNLCIAGGVALNCKMNGVLRTESGCERLFVQPAANDAGAALGAALLLSQQIDRTVRFPLQHTHYGPGFDNDQIRNTLDTCRLDYEKPNDVVEAAARLIADERVVGWFQGRMEFGSRALGGRSILANPCAPDMADKVNRLVKFREPWRPFCPSMSEGVESDWLESGEPAPFMIVAYDAQPGWKQRLPAVVHADGSVRPQTVSGSLSPADRPENRFRSLIDAVGGHTGQRVVLNTSFNVRGEPIVCTPLDAVRCFMGTGMEAMVAGDFLLKKKGVW